MNENTRTSVEKVTGEIKVTQNQSFSKRIYEKTDSIFTLVYMVLGYTFVRFFFFYDWNTNFGFALPLYTTAYIFTVIFYAKAKGKAISKESFFWIGIMACIALTFKIEYFFILTLQILVAAYFTAVTGGLYSGGTSAYLTADLWNTFFSLPFTNFFNVFPAFFALFKRKDKKSKSAVNPAVWGAVLAAGALRFIVPLLIQADSNFLSGTTDFINHLFEGLFGDDNVLFFANMILSVPVTCYLYGLAYGSMAQKKHGAIEKSELDSARTKLRISPALTLKVFLYTVCAVYVMFITLQADYLLGAFTGRLYGTMTYAEYARTGFFELCKVAAINLSLLILCNLLIIETEDEKIKTPAALLCVLSLILLSTAMAKMIMYIIAYGLTEKRIISTVFLIWLMLVFTLCLFRLKSNFNITRTAVLAGAVMFCILFSFDIPVHCHNFNEKYGFEEQVPVVEVYQGDNTLLLPHTDEISHISLTDSNGTIYDDILYCGEIIDLINSSDDTAIPVIQDYPDADFYYIMNIHSHNGNIDTIYIYNRSRTGGFYIEQPYNVICRNYFNWDSILAPYKI